MLMFVFLLSVLIIPKVCSKPTVNNSDLASPIKKEELRLKRQATFFDLLHQAIEKYANCADEHLAPLKSLASYNPYETLIPEKYSPTNKAIVGAAAYSNPNNKPNIKCRRVSLCTITGQNSFGKTADNNNPAKLEKAVDTKINISQRLPYLFGNGNDKNKQPLYDFRKQLPKLSVTRYSHNKNLYNQDFLNRLFNRPTADRRKQILHTVRPEAILGSPSAQAANSMKKKSCFCLENNRMEIILNKTTKDAELLQFSNQPENKEDINSGPCLEIVNYQQQQTDGLRLESDEVLGSVADKNLSPNEAKEFGENLDQILMQLDEMAERASNVELRQILEKLKNLKSAFDTNFDSKEDHSIVTTPVPILVGAPASQQAPKQFGFSNLAVDLLSTIFKPNNAIKSVKGCATAITKRPYNKDNVFKSKGNLKEDFNGEHIKYNTSPYDSHLLGEEINTSFLESYNLKDSSELLKEDVHKTVKESSQKVPEAKKLHCFLSEIKSENLPKSYDFVGISRPTALALNISNSQNLKLIKEEKHTNLDNSKAFIRQESIEYLTTSPILSLNHKNSHILSQPKDETDTLLSPLESQILRDYYDETISEPPILYRKTSNKQNEMKTFVPSKNTYPKQSQQNHGSGRVVQGPVVAKKYENTQDNISEPQTNCSKTDRKDSKITISITSNGHFKQIHVEHHAPDDKKLEINEEENMNLATTKSKGQLKDMVGTGSRFISVVKQPQKIDSYAEPILSEIYPAAKSKPSTKPPLSIYYHKIEKQTPKLKREPNGVWHTFQSSDVLDCGNCAEKKLGTS